MFVVKCYVDVKLHLISTLLKDKKGIYSVEDLP